MRTVKAALGPVLLASLLLAGCTSDTGGDGLSAAEVEGIVESAVAGMDVPEAGEGLSAAEVEAIVESAVAGMPVADEGLSAGEVEAIVESAIAGVAVADPGLSAGEVEAIVESAIAGMDVPVSDEGLSAGEVEAIVESAIAGMDVPVSDEGLSAGEVEAIVESAIAGMDVPEADEGLSAAEVEGIARGVVAKIPSRDAAAEYTKFVVSNAISRYESEGLEATLSHYNSIDSVDGQWYVFVIGTDDTVIGHYDPGRRGLDVKGWVGTDANGYVFGGEMLSATEDGRWVSYVYGNPTSGDINLGDPGDLELKNVWVVRHDGLLFASGWYTPAEKFLQDLVGAFANQLVTAGLEATLTEFTQPSGFAGGLQQILNYYENAENADGRWIGFIADESGTLVSAFNNPELVGTSVVDLLGTSVLDAPSAGAWVTEVVADPESPTDSLAQSVRIWVVNRGGYTVGGGWYRPPAG